MNDAGANVRHGADVRPHLALFVVQLMFGTWPIVGKMALRVLPSTGLVALRIAGATVAFALLTRLTTHVRVTRRSDYARFALYSLLGVVLNQFLFTKGLAHSTVINATILGTCIPVFALLTSVLLGTEEFSRRKALGTFIAACGVVYLVDPFRAEFSGDKTFGNLLLIANTIAYGAYIALSQEMFRRYGALTVITWVFAIGSIAAVPFGGYYLAQTPLENLGWQVWLSILYIIVVPTVGAYYLNAWALERVAPSTVAVYIYLQPLIAFAIAPLVLGSEESWSARTGVATLLIFAGVAIVTMRAHVMRDVSEHPDAIGH